MNKLQSPFDQKRFEYDPEHRHVYYLPQPLFSKLEIRKPIYIVGSRGTGKTTLLRALSWQERVNNKSLLAAINNEPFAKKYLGLYLKVSECDTNIFDDWLINTTLMQKASICSLYLDLLWTELFVITLTELVTLKHLDFSVELENECVKFIVKEIPKLSNFLDRNIKTLLDIKDAANKMHHDLHDWALFQKPMENFEELFPIGKIGEFGKVIGAGFNLLLNNDANSENGNDWHVKVCLDEAEFFSHDWQLTINTIVRTAKMPIMYVIAYVAKRDDLSDTVKENMTLQVADRDLELLDDMRDAEFKIFCEGVTNARLNKILGTQQIDFKVDTMLGKLKINDLLARILRESENPAAKELLKEAFKFKLTDFYKDIIAKNEEENDAAIPIYQVYLINKLNIEIPKPDSQQWERRRQDSAELRKRNVAAYLYICNELGLQVRYATGPMLMQMCDCCVRDYLLQMDSIYSLINKKSEELLAVKKVAIDLQDRALKKASKDKIQSLPSSGVSRAVDIQKLVDGLALITSKLQNDPNEIANLRSSERGIFVVKTTSNFPNKDEIIKLINEASEAGFLKNSGYKGEKIKFRVHCSLAPAYGFSYRGAYYPTNISFDNLNQLVSTFDDDRYKTVVDSIVSQLNRGGDDDLPLFPNGDNI